MGGEMEEQSSSEDHGVTVGGRVLAQNDFSPATKLLEKRRLMFEIQDALEEKKLEYNKKEEGFKKREEILKKKDAELQDSLVKFSKFLQENESKKLRAEKKAADEIKTRLQKEAEIESLNQEIKLLQQSKETLQKKLEKRMRYHKYLESVLEVSDEYQEVQDILSRHATLQATHMDLIRQQEESAAMTDALRSNLQLEVKQRTDEILNLNNELSELKKELEVHKQNAIQQQGQRDYSLQMAAKKTLEYGQIVMSTDNVFARCRQMSGIGHAAETNTLAQLDIIGNFVSDLAVIVKSLKVDQPKKQLKT